MYCGACTELPKMPWHRLMKIFKPVPAWCQWINACKQEYGAPICSTLLYDFGPMPLALFTALVLSPTAAKKSSYYDQKLAQHAGGEIWPVYYNPYVYGTK